jgi:N-acyl-D-aspartate/D-glutamate deacylase
MGVRGPAENPRLLMLTVGLALVGCAASPEAPVDLLIRGGLLVDGTGAEPRPADVAIVDGRIHALGALGALAAKREIDATGLVVAPGFVDLHSHADLILLGDARTQQRLLAAKIGQGVTTVVVGNCGLGVAPADGDAAEILAGLNGWMTPEGVRAGALTIREYLERLERAGVALNVATLLPHGPLRISAMGLDGGEPTPEQLREMREVARAGLQAGAYGLSTGLIYPPGMYSSTDELVALAEVVAEADRLYTSHIRGSSEMLVPATRELVEVARRSGARVHHSHLEAVGQRFWPRLAEILAAEDAARDSGLTLSHDVFLYNRAATMMSAIFPPWSLEGGVSELLKRLEDPGQRARIRREIEQRVPEWPPWQPGGWPHNLVGAVGWDGILVASVGSSGRVDYVGRNLAELGEELGSSPFDVVAELMLANDGQVGQLVDEISGREDTPEYLLSIFTHPSAAVISDAEDFGRGTPHPGHAGAFVRALRLNREHDLMPLEQVLRRMTGYPAALLGLDRGTIRQGFAADLVVFDPDTAADQATWREPRRPAVGVIWVVLNGEVVVDDRRYVGGLHGQVLRASSNRDH